MDPPRSEFDNLGYVVRVDPAEELQQGADSLGGGLEHHKHLGGPLETTVPPVLRLDRPPARARCEPTLQGRAYARPSASGVRPGGQNEPERPDGVVSGLRNWGHGSRSRWTDADGKSRASRRSGLPD